MIYCIHYQITMMKLMLFTFILVGFKIQDNLAFSYPEICYGDKCYDELEDKGETDGFLDDEENNVKKEIQFNDFKCNV